jgi:hypothetical protein
MANFRGKIGIYQAALNLSPAQVTAAQTLCEAYIEAYDFAENVDNTGKAVTKWRNDIFRGEPVGGPVPDPPVFAIGTPSPGTLGVVTQFLDLREQLVVNPGFNDAMGEDLGILGPEIDDEPEGEVAPSLKITSELGFKVNISGSMQGNSQIRIEYRKSGTTTWVLVMFLTNLPAEVTVTPSVDGQPETGDIRGTFYRKNQPYGVPSPNYAVTLS